MIDLNMRSRALGLTPWAKEAATALWDLPSSSSIGSIKLEDCGAAGSSQKLGSCYAPAWRSAWDVQEAYSASTSSSIVRVGPGT
jgi:hypothetical protein